MHNSPNILPWFLIGSDLGTYFQAVFRIVICTHIMGIIYSFLDVIWQYWRLASSGLHVDMLQVLWRSHGKVLDTDQPSHCKNYSILTGWTRWGRYPLYMSLLWTGTPYQYVSSPYLDTRTVRAIVTLGGVLLYIKDDFNNKEHAKQEIVDLDHNG